MTNAAPARCAPAWASCIASPATEADAEVRLTTTTGFAARPTAIERGRPAFSAATRGAVCALWCAFFAGFDVLALARPRAFSVSTGCVAAEELDWFIASVTNPR